MKISATAISADNYRFPQEGDGQPIEQPGERKYSSGVPGDLAVYPTAQLAVLAWGQALTANWSNWGLDQAPTYHPRETACQWQAFTKKLWPGVSSAEEYSRAGWRIPSSDPRAESSAKSKNEGRKLLSFFAQSLHPVLRQLLTELTKLQK